MIHQKRSIAIFSEGSCDVKIWSRHIYLFIDVVVASFNYLETQY